MRRRPGIQGLKVSAEARVRAALPQTRLLTARATPLLNGARQVPRQWVAGPLQSARADSGRHKAGARPRSDGGFQTGLGRLCTEAQACFMRPLASSSVFCGLSTLVPAQTRCCAYVRVCVLVLATTILPPARSLWQHCHLHCEDVRRPTSALRPPAPGPHAGDEVCLSVGRAQAGSAGRAGSLPTARRKQEPRPPQPARRAAAEWFERPPCNSKVWLLTAQPQSRGTHRRSA